MDLMSKALVQGTRLIEYDYGSVDNAPQSSLEWLHKIAKPMVKKRQLSHNIRAYVSKDLKPFITDDYRIFKGWHKLCYGHSVKDVALECRISSNALSNLRRKIFSYNFNHQTQLRYQSLPKLINKIKAKDILGPRSAYMFNLEKHKYYQGQTTKFPGHCYVRYELRPLIFRTDNVNIVAKIPEDAK